jgi:hypothetical protein
MTAITIAPAASPRSLRTTIQSKPIVVVGAAAGVVAALAASATAAIAKAAGVPLVVGPQSAKTGEVIPVSGFAVGTLMCTAAGIVIALLLAWRAKNPARTFAIVAVVLTFVSFLFPLTTGHATFATRAVLELTHVVAAAIVIPALVLRLERGRTTAH